MNRLFKQLHQAACVGQTDQELLSALIENRDQAAFEALLYRHGPMVLSVCQRVLHNLHDAEDAFQTTFLLLIRKATSVRNRAVVGSWLHGVAYRTALKARSLNARRQLKEREAALQFRPRSEDNGALLDEELKRLPEKYRVPMVLCELEGRSRKEVARLLGIPEGTLSSRLATARDLLARRLSRQQLGLGRRLYAPAVLSTALLASTVQAAVPILTGASTSAFVSVQVMTLTQEVTKAMFHSKLKALTAAFFCLAALGIGTGRWTYRALAEGPTALEPAQAKAAPQKNLELEEARAKLEQARAALAAAKAQLEQSESHYRTAVERAQRVDDNVVASNLGPLLAKQFKYKVSFELGHTETKGGSIEIHEVWGTRPRIEVGGQYIVRGKYSMPSQEGGEIYLYRTATDANVSGPNMDLQQTQVTKDKGEFTLMHGMHGTGYLHLQLIGSTGGKTIQYANVYFGTGDTVWRNK